MAFGILVDMGMAGQYHGSEGTAALAVVAPVWNVIYSLGLLMGIGGSVLFSTIRGREESHTGRSNEYFAASMLGAAGLVAIVWTGRGGSKPEGDSVLCGRKQFLYARC